MPSDDAAILRELRDAIGRLNAALRGASEAGLSAEIEIGKQAFVGRRAELLIVTGRVQRSRIELDERL